MTSEPNEFIEEDQQASSKTLLQEIKGKALELLADSTWHGLPSVMSKKNAWAKFFWLLIFSISFGVCVYMIIAALVSYFEYTVLVKYSMVHESEFEFPAVTFCNLNPIDTKKDPYLQVNITNLYAFFLDPTKLDNITLEAIVCDQVSQRFVQLLIGLDYSTAFYSIDDMLISCMYNGIKCSSDEFVIQYLGLYGSCFTWNSGLNANGKPMEIRKTYSPGISTGLRLELFVGEAAFQPCWVDTMGAIVSIHDRSVDPLIPIEGMKLKTGQEANIALNRVFVNKLGKPFSNCIRDTQSNMSYDSYWYQYTFNFVKTYRQSYCVYLCSMTMSLRGACLRVNANYTIDELRNCLSQIGNGNLYYSQCFQECPLECSSTTIFTAQNFADYPTNVSTSSRLRTNSNFSMFFSSPPTFEQIKASTLAVNVYYESNYYTAVEDVPEDNFETLLAKIGGHLALFLGLSVLSLFEVVEFIIILIHLFIPRIKCSSLGRKDAYKHKKKQLEEARI